VAVIRSVFNGSIRQYLAGDAGPSLVDTTRDLGEAANAAIDILSKNLSEELSDVELTDDNI